MQERPATELPRVSERDLDEVLQSLEVELYSPPKKLIDREVPVRTPDGRRLL